MVIESYANANIPLLQLPSPSAFEAPVSEPRIPSRSCCTRSCFRQARKTFRSSCLRATATASATWTSAAGSAALRIFWATLKIWSVCCVWKIPNAFQKTSCRTKSHQKDWPTDSQPTVVNRPLPLELQPTSHSPQVEQSSPGKCFPHALKRAPGLHRLVINETGASYFISLIQLCLYVQLLCCHGSTKLHGSCINKIMDLKCH